MATMISELYDALIAAGAPEEKARKAAEAIAGYERSPRSRRICWSSSGCSALWSQ
jgi:hypothetical protein